MNSLLQAVKSCYIEERNFECGPQDLVKFDSQVKLIIENESPNLSEAEKNWNITFLSSPLVS